MARDGEEAITTSKRDRRGEADGETGKKERAWLCSSLIYRGERDPAFVADAVRVRCGAAETNGPGERMSREDKKIKAPSTIRN